LRAPAARHVGLQQQPFEIVRGGGPAVVRPVPVPFDRGRRGRRPRRRFLLHRRRRRRRGLLAEQSFLRLVDGRVQVHGRPSGRRAHDDARPAAVAYRRYVAGAHVDPARARPVVLHRRRRGHGRSVAAVRVTVGPRPLRT